MVTKKTATKTAPSEGEVRLTIGDSGYTPPAITPARVAAYLRNIHGKTPIINLLPQVFPGEPEVWVEDSAGERDDTLTDWIRETAEEVCLYAAMKITWFERMGYGASVKSPGYSRINGRVELTELRNLPAITFGFYPGRGDVQNSLMPGIVTVGDTVEVWQTQGDDLHQVRINNAVVITDPTAPKPAGEAYILPVYAVIAALDHANKGADQQVQRIAAPIIFPQIAEKMTDGLKTWGDKFVKAWGKNTGFIVPPGITFPDIKITETTVAERRLDMLVRWIESYFNPTTILQKSGTTIGASDKGASQIWVHYLSAIQAEIEEAHEQFFRPLLEKNGYEDRYVRIQLKRPDLDRSAERREQVKLAADTNAITPEEIRRNLPDLDLDDTTPELLEQLKAQKPVRPANPFGNVFGNAKDADEAAAISARTEDRLKRINDAAEKRILKLIGE